MPTIGKTSGLDKQFSQDAKQHTSQRRFLLRARWRYNYCYNTTTGKILSLINNNNNNSIPSSLQQHFMRFLLQKKENNFPSSRTSSLPLQRRIYDGNGLKTRPTTLSTYETTKSTSYITKRRWRSNDDATQKRRNYDRQEINFALPPIIIFFGLVIDFGIYSKLILNLDKFVHSVCDRACLNR